MSDSHSSFDTIVVGAGSAGLAVSRCLQREDIAHVVLERDVVGASWRRRWDSFHLNTPNGVSVLPGDEPAADPEGYLSRDAWLEVMETYRARHDLPVRTGVEVSSIRPTEEGYEVITGDETLRSKNVVLCTGDQNVPRIPTLASSLPDDIAQLHSHDYRAPSQLPEGAVLVVGSGQTGAQIVEDLLDAGRTVWMCTSKVGRVSRRYRGRDVTSWAQATGMAEQSATDVPEEERRGKQPMVSGTRGGHSISLQSLGNAGARLLGRLVGVDGRALRIGDDLAANVAFGDASATKLRAGLDLFIEKAGVDAPPPEPDPVDAPWPGLEEMAAVRDVDLDQASIRSVIWATGFGGDFSYVAPELLDEEGHLRNTDGVCAPGLYCVGLMWQRTRISGLIPGAALDAEAVVERIAGD